MSFEGKNLYGQYIDYSEKKWPKGFICPYTGTIFYKICIYSRSQVSVYRTIGPLFFFLFFVFFFVFFFAAAAATDLLLTLLSCQ